MALVERAVVLVVDDDERNRTLAEAILEASGYRVRLASSGAEALRAFEESAADLVLLDVRMPGMDGYEACRLLRLLPEGADVPVLFLTASTDLTSHERALASGADDFLTKPLNRTELLLRIQSLIRVRELQRQLRVNYEVIRQQRDALVRAERQKQELTDLIVHDLKSPLAGIVTNVDYALGAGPLAPDVREALHDVSTCAETMLRMVLNLLDVSRSEDGALVARLGEVDAAVLLERVRGATQRRADSEGRRLEVAEVIGPLLFRGDRELLRRVLENLVDNCLKYTPPEAAVVLGAERRGDRVRLFVKDRGAGIPQDQRERIFEKYAQLGAEIRPATRTSRGLGLVFCKRAAEAHGGRIWVEDNTPTGSTFVVELPG